MNDESKTIRDERLAFAKDLQETFNTGHIVATMNETKVTLTNASTGVLQDAWHYATLITRRQDSTFDGDRTFPDGIRGQVRAYESLLSKLDHMTADNETWELVRSQWWEPETFEQMKANAAMALEAINDTAKRLGIDARTGEKPEQ